MAEYRAIGSTGALGYYALYLCEVCGSVVNETDKHDAWHQWFEYLIDALPGVVRE